MHNQYEELATSMIGTWWLLSRIDEAKGGTIREEHTLGSDPLGILTYAPNHFAAQFMKRDRSKPSNYDAPSSGKNNTSAIGGYDAYFGTYEVEKDTGKVLHKLEAALTQSNVGAEVSRNLNVKGNMLEIILATTTTEGEPIIRTLTWKRIG